MDVLYLVQWIGCVAALFGGTVAAWLAEPDEAAAQTPRRRFAVGGGALLLVAVVGWWLSVDLDSASVDSSEQAASFTAAALVVALVFLVLLLTAPDRFGAHAARWYRRAAGTLVAGFGVAVSSSLQVALVGDAWSTTSWVTVGGFVLACAVVVLAHPEEQ